jgi:hypothetical protein
MTRSFTLHIDFFDSFFAGEETFCRSTRARSLYRLLALYIMNKLALASKAPRDWTRSGAVG